MSSELDRLLRDARRTLPEPGHEETARARMRALAAIHRHRRKARAAILVAVVVVAAVLGVVLGAAIAPKGTAAREAAGIGLLPAPGWYALQSPPPAVEGQPAVALAANVPFARDDAVRGLADPSGLPYSTLLRLPPRGAVIVASLTQRMTAPATPIPYYPEYPEADLPLDVEDAVPLLYFGAQVRPEQPLGQYELRVAVRGYNVDIIFYFGTPRPPAPLLAETQRQLDRLVISALPTRERASATASTTPSSTISVLDRTYICTTVLHGGLYEIETSAHAGQRLGGAWSRLPYAAVMSGFPQTLVGSEAAPTNSLAWITAGTPTSRTTAGETWDSFRVRAGGTMGVNRNLCNRSSAFVPLTPDGLNGGSLTPRRVGFDCEARRSVLVRVRARLRTSAPLRSFGPAFFATTDPVVDAKLAVRASDGRPLLFAEVRDSGAARSFVSPKCSPDS